MLKIIETCETESIQNADMAIFPQFAPNTETDEFSNGEAPGIDVQILATPRELAADNSSTEQEKDGEEEDDGFEEFIFIDEAE